MRTTLKQGLVHGEQRVSLIKDAQLLCCRNDGLAPFLFYEADDEDPDQDFQILVIEQGKELPRYDEWELRHIDTLVDSLSGEVIHIFHMLQK